MTKNSASDSGPWASEPRWGGQSTDWRGFPIGSVSVPPPAFHEEKLEKRYGILDDKEAEEGDDQDKNKVSPEASVAEGAVGSAEASVSALEPGLDDSAASASGQKLRWSALSRPSVFLALEGLRWQEGQRPRSVQLSQLAV